MRGLRTCGVALCFAAFWGGSVVLGWTWLLVGQAWPGTATVKMRRAQRTMQRGFRAFHFLMRALRLYHRTSPSATLRPDGAAARSPCVVVANHPTLCDVTSIVSLFPNVVALARPGLGYHPLLRRGLRTCGFVTVGSRMMLECQERLRMGFDVLIFPEGTRSPVGRALQPFHRGAFELAARARVPVVLVKLTCAPSALSKRLPLWKIADRMAVLTIEPVDMIHPAESDLDSRAWARTIERRYHELLDYPAPPLDGSAPPPAGGAR